MLKEEVERRNKIKELLSNDQVKEFLNLCKLDAGLSSVDNEWQLVKDLLKKHKELEQERTIIENYYIQNLIIKQKIK